jgi:hypothetical protein
MPVESRTGSTSSYVLRVYSYSLLSGMILGKLDSFIHRYEEPLLMNPWIAGAGYGLLFGSLFLVGMKFMFHLKHRK